MWLWVLACAIPADAWHGVVPALRSDPAELDIDDAPLAVSTTTALLLINDGGAPADVSLSIDAPFSLDQAQVEIAAGGSVEIRVGYTAQGYDPIAGTLHADAGASTLDVAIHARTDPDSDGDGQDAFEAGGSDCDDTDASVYSGATETCYDGVEQDCGAGRDQDCDGDGAGVELDCDDDDAGVYPDAVEGNNDQDDDCDGLVDETGFYAGMLVISEIAADFPPWVEICSTGPAIHLDGMSLHGVATPALLVPELGCVALCEQVDTTCAGTLAIDLDDAEDSLALSAGSLAVDTVAWTTSWPSTGGLVRSLDGAQLDATLNDDPDAWCLGDGTPGEPNPACP